MDQPQACLSSTNTAATQQQAQSHAQNNHPSISKDQADQPESMSEGHSSKPSSQASLPPTQPLSQSSLTPIQPLSQSSFTPTQSPKPLTQRSSGDSQLRRQLMDSQFRKQFYSFSEAVPSHSQVSFSPGRFFLWCSMCETLKIQNEGHPNNCLAAAVV